MKATVKDLHTSSSILVGFTILGLLTYVAQTPWWSSIEGHHHGFQLWLYGACGMLIGMIATLLVREYGNTEKWKYYLTLATRASIVIALLKEALLKYHGHFYELSLITKQISISEMDDSTMANAFMGYSSSYESWTGAVLLLGLTCLCFNRSLRLGYIVLGAGLLQTVAINYNFDTFHLFKPSIYLAAIVYLMYTDIFSLLGFLTKTKPYITYTYRPVPLHFQHLHKSASLYKGALYVGLIVFMMKDVSHKKNHSHNPIAGVWNVSNISYSLENWADADIRKLHSIDKIIIDEGRYGAFESEDSLSYFEFMIDPNNNKLEFWNFFNQMDFELKGEYKQLSDSNIVYYGRNHELNTNVIITLDKQKSE